MAIKTIDELPDVSFIDGVSLENIRSQLVDDYCKKHKELTGKSPDMPADAIDRLILGACALQIYQGFQFIERAGKMNLLKYSYGEYLDNLAALKNLTRKKSAPSIVTIRFARKGDLTLQLKIPAGTRVTTANYDVSWTTPEFEDVILPARKSYVDIVCMCSEPGAFSNGYEIGEIKVLMDSLQNISEATNVTVSSGGTDDESDEDFKQRILLSPSGYSTAGTADSYAYFIKNYDTRITDVHVQTEDDAQVSIYLLSKSGLPTESQIKSIQSYIDNAEIRPLTDKVTVYSGVPQSYDVNLTYYISNSDKSKENTIKEAVETAVEEYIQVQNSKLGKDIDSSILIQKVMNAGANRVVVNSPSYQEVDVKSFPTLNSSTINYGGLE